MHHDTIYWVGLAVCLTVALFATWVIGEVVWAAVVAASFVRFHWRAARLRGASWRPALRRAPRLFLHNWGHFIGFRKGVETIDVTNGTWRGVGDWSVSPPGGPTPWDKPKEQSHDGCDTSGHERMQWKG